MSRRLRFVLAAMVASLATLWWFRARVPQFAPLRDGQAIAPGWTAVMTEGEPGDSNRYRFGLRDAGGKLFPLTALSFDALSLATIRTPQGLVIVTRYEGGGSSGATYYSFYRVTATGLTQLPASELRDWGPDEPCLDEPAVQSPPKISATVFGACPSPEWNDDHAVFHLPGFHCSQWQSGGCATEHVVRW